MNKYQFAQGVQGKVFVYLDLQWGQRDFTRCVFSNYASGSQDAEQQVRTFLSENPSKIDPRMVRVEFKPFSEIIELEPPVFRKVSV